MAKGKEITGYIKLQIPAGQARPAPPLGPALGQRGLPIPEFCKRFNDATAQMEPGLLLPVIITVFSDRSYDFLIKQPPMSVLIRKALGLKKGSSAPGKESVGTMTYEQMVEVAQQKMPDLNAGSLEAAVRIVAGQARSMGLQVETPAS